MSLGNPPSHADVEAVKELDTQTFGAWKNNPITLIFLKYLAHLGDHYRLVFLNEWESGASLSEVDAKRRELEIRGRVLMLEDLTTLDLAAIREAYGVRDESDAERHERATPKAG